MQRISIIALLCLVAITVYPQEKRLAIVIGNSDYQYGGSLDNPVNDARSMEEILKAVGFDVIKYENLDQKIMRQAIDNFGTLLKNYDIGLFFFAGHGIQAKGFNYLIPVDATLTSETDVEYNCVRADRVLGKMESAENQTNIVILDACRNNPFERSWTRAPTGKGLAFMNAPTGSLIAYATSPGNTASDGMGDNGLYTSALLTYIVEPNITVIEMFQKVRTTVREYSEGNQTPWESTSLEGNFFFNGSGESLDVSIVQSQIKTGNKIETSVGISEKPYNINDSVFFFAGRNRIIFGRIVGIHEITSLHQISYASGNKNKISLVEREKILRTENEYEGFKINDRIAYGVLDAQKFTLYYGPINAIFPSIGQIQTTTDNGRKILVSFNMSIVLDKNVQLIKSSLPKGKCSTGEEVYFVNSKDYKLQKGIIVKIGAVNIEISYMDKGINNYLKVQKLRVFKIAAI